MLELVIGNKNYSSWSLRPWIAMRVKNIDFTDRVIPLDTPDTARFIGAESPSGCVPVLHHDNVTVWDSLAILEYLAELYPDRGFWPADRAARAHARAVSQEMHAGFTALRSACPMNLRRAVKPSPLMGPAVEADVRRIEEIWSSCRAAHGAGGPFLFGEFTIADAMYAPVVTRLHTFAVPVTSASRAYMDAVMGATAFHEWRAAALAESWIVPSDEVD